MQTSTENPIHDFFAVLRRRIWVPILCVLLLPALALALTQFQDEKYEATAKLLFRSSGSIGEILGNPADPGDSSDPGRQAATNTELVSLSAVADNTAKALGIPVAG